VTAPDVPELPDEHNVPLFLRSRRQGTNFGNQLCLQHIPTANCFIPTLTVKHAETAQTWLLVSPSKNKISGALEKLSLRGREEVRASCHRASVNSTFVAGCSRDTTQALSHHGHDTIE